MSEAKFTQGKWTARIDDSAVQTSLIYLSDKGGFDLSGSPDCIANAHLIAAAPEMYEMLGEINNWFIKESVFSGDGHNDIEILLAKARGDHD